MKTWYKSKTLWASVITIISGLAAFLTGEQEAQEVVITVVGALFGLLRLVTDKHVTF